MYFLEKLAKKRNNPAVPITAGVAGAGATGAGLYGLKRLSRKKGEQLLEENDRLFTNIKFLRDKLNLGGNLTTRIANRMLGRENPGSLSADYLLKLDKHKPRRTGWRGLRDRFNPLRLSEKKLAKRRSDLEAASRSLKDYADRYAQNVESRRLYKNIGKAIIQKRVYIPALLGGALIAGLGAHAIQNRVNRDDIIQ